MDTSYTAILPEIILGLTGILVMLLIPSTSPQRQARLGIITLGGMGFALLATILQWGQRSVSFHGMFLQDSLAHFSKAVFLLAAGAITLLSIHYLQQEGEKRGEYFSLLLFATLGMCVMASSADLVLTFLGLETLSIATYVLAAYRLHKMQSTESALKYFLLGAFSTAFLLYGIALVYGVTASTSYPEIATAIAGVGRMPVLLLAGLALIVVGFGFKIAIVPFHVWTPDVYQGAPLPITVHLAVASKAAALIAFLRLLYQVFPGLESEWSQILWISAVLTMLVGNLAALVQTNIKRMLAYSSIAHAGYLLVGLAAHNAMGAQSVLFYLLAYTFMNVGAFAVVELLAGAGEGHVHIEDYSGLGLRHPFLGIALGVFLISLAGIPLTAGFSGKLFLLSAAIRSEMYWLVVIALIASAIGVYYYLRVLVVLFMHPDPGTGTDIRLPLTTGVVIAFMLIGTLYLGILPARVLELASEAVRF